MSVTQRIGERGRFSKVSKVELLAPAGNFEKLRIAVHYGADAVYLGGTAFSLRDFSENFTSAELKRAVDFAKRRGVRTYITCNVFPRNTELHDLSQHLLRLAESAPDAIIVSDPGIFMEARERIPDIPLHISTQANTTNWRTVRFWENLGAKRINLARELSLTEIREMALHSQIELEAFIHGAMCISYSGRCLLSSYLTGRDGNRGQCAHPCRWQYAVVEEKRPGQYMPVAEDDRGTTIFSSKDLCTIAYIGDIIESGLSALKIEGRMKGILYLATAVRVYREAIDNYYQNPSEFSIKAEWIKELESINIRGYSSGFYFGDPGAALSPFEPAGKANRNLLIGKILEKIGAGKYRIDVRNKLVQGESIEILCDRGPIGVEKAEAFFDPHNMSLPLAKPGTEVFMHLKGNYSIGDIIRRKI